MHGAGGVVVGIEKVSVLRNGIPISRHPLFQNEGFKKPGGMGEMPLRRADVRHRLNDTIFRRQIFGKSASETAELAEPRQKIVPRQKGLARARRRGRCSIFFSDRGLDQVLSPSCSS